MNSVFVIMNEWQSIDYKTGSRVVDSKFFTNEGEAYGALYEIAQANGLELPEGENNFFAEDIPSNLDYDEYYIQELVNGDLA